MKCITRWFAEKKDQTCPCCREKSSQDEIIGRKSKDFMRHEEHVHIDNQWVRNIECPRCRDHVESLERICIISREREQSDRDHSELKTRVIVTLIIVLCHMVLSKLLLED